MKERTFLCKKLTKNVELKIRAKFRGINFREKKLQIREIRDFLRLKKQTKKKYTKSNSLKGLKHLLFHRSRLDLLFPVSINQSSVTISMREINKVCH